MHVRHKARVATQTEASTVYVYAMLDSSWKDLHVLVSCNLF